MFLAKHFGTKPMFLKIFWEKLMFLECFVAKSKCFWKTFWKNRMSLINKAQSTCFLTFFCWTKMVLENIWRQKMFLEQILTQRKCSKKRFYKNPNFSWKQIRKNQMFMESLWHKANVAWTHFGTKQCFLKTISVSNKTLSSKSDRTSLKRSRFYS